MTTYGAEETEQFQLASVSQVDALVLHCCITTDPTMHSKRYLLFHTVSVSQESGKWAWLNWVVLVQVSHELSVKISDSLTGLEDLLSNFLVLGGGFSFWLQGSLLKAAHNKRSWLPTGRIM